jgi:hypothetical protein
MRGIRPHFGKGLLTICLDIDLYVDNVPDADFSVDKVISCASQLVFLK